MKIKSSAHREGPIRPFTLRHGGPGLTVLIAIAMCSAGCQTQPTFTPGTAAGEFGTIDDPGGNTYKIIEQNDDSLTVEVEGVDGDLTLSIDSEGRLTGIELVDGSKMNFQYITDSMALVSGTGMFGGNSVTFSVTIDVPPLTTSKVWNRAQKTGTAFSVCVAIDRFCEHLEELISDLLPKLLDEIIAENLPAIIAEINKDSFIPIPENLPFPTGIESVDSAIRNEAMAQIEPYLTQARNLCAHWQLLRLLEISACDI